MLRAHAAKAWDTGYNSRCTYTEFTQKTKACGNAPDAAGSLLQP